MPEYSGTVKDAAGNPLSGVSIHVVDQGTGIPIRQLTTTDSQGQYYGIYDSEKPFSLQFISGEQIKQFKYEGKPIHVNMESPDGIVFTREGVNFA